METKALMGFVLLLLFVGMLIGVGVLTIDKFGRATRTTTTITDGKVNVSGGATLTQTYCLAISDVTKSTETTSFYDKANLTFSDADACKVTGALPTNQTYNITYTYGKTTATATAMINTNSAITPIAGTWLPLLVTVFVLAIIMGLVLSSFGIGRK